MAKRTVPLYLVMGVSGSGKTTMGRMLAERLGVPFHDGDDYHPEANVQKMAAGIPLEDADRWGWLDRLHELAVELSEGNGGVIACSALKKVYRDRLEGRLSGQLDWIYLKGEYNTLLDRMESREGHFMPKDLLRSQFDTLEEPRRAIELDVVRPPEKLLDDLMEKLMPEPSRLGLIGLGVMGKSLSLNLAEKGFPLSLYNRRVEGLEENVALDFIGEHSLLKQARGYESLAPFIASLEKPRKILLMIPAGKPLDLMIDQLLPLLSGGDILLDGGNSHYLDTERRQAALRPVGIHWLGVGVSGGEAGARKGPSLMPGGELGAYREAEAFLLDMAARDTAGRPCCAYIGPAGSGHFVKMVHNGVEYAEMQLLAETYDLLRNGYGWAPDRVADLLEGWQQEGQDSFLLDITIAILRKKEGDHYLLDRILDRAGNKGTGSWTVQAAAVLGVPVPNLSAALFARYQSSFKTRREQAAERYPLRSSFPRGQDPRTEPIRRAYGLARLVNHHQGFHLLQAASEDYQWQLELGEIARVWTNGCIIRSALMEDLSRHSFAGGQLLLEEPYLSRVRENSPFLEQVIRAGLDTGTPLPGYAATWQYVLAYFSAILPANLIQAQRDLFGAHGYRRVEEPDGPPRHTDWQKP